MSGAPQATLHNKPLVLIVDDSRAIRLFVRELLEPVGYAVIEANDGAQGLEAIAHRMPDVVLLDIEMPNKNGLEVLAELDAENRLYSVIMFTSRSSLDAIVSGLEHGADDYVVKPFKEPELLARVAAAMRISHSKKLLLKARIAAEESAECMRLMQEKLLAKERMLAIARLAAGAAHQINNPLGFIVSNMKSLGKYSDNLLMVIDDLSSGTYGKEPDILKERKVAKIRSDLPDLLQETNQGLQRIALIVSGLTKLEVGLHQGDHQLLEVNSLLVPLVHILENELPDGTIVVWSPYTNHLPVCGNLQLLNTAFNAIFKNAHEAVNSPGVPIHIATDQIDSSAVITITNTTAIVSDENEARYFEPFYSSKSPELHCGLGLTIAERFIASHLGTVSVKRRKSGEVCITVTLPLSAELYSE